MPLLTIRHVTDYRYRRAVSFGEHRMMMRPRESFDQHLRHTRLVIDPPPRDLRWLHDVFGNAVAIATFDGRADRLTVVAESVLDHSPLDASAVDVEPYARRFPFTYASEDMPDLLRSMERQYLDPARIVDTWARGFVHGDGARGGENDGTGDAPGDRGDDTVALLCAMARSIRRDFTYVPRHEQGTQPPIDTLRRRGGTCRDFAVLMMEAVRALGFAARFVSGYVYDPARGAGRVGGGNTHAWVRVFLPGSGWVEFDPTNGIVGSQGLVRVAVARDPYQAVPLHGSWTGFPDSFLSMSVDVDVALAPRPVPARSSPGLTADTARETV